jgi:hypothetical protein
VYEAVVASATSEGEIDDLMRESGMLFEGEGNQFEVVFPNFSLLMHQVGKKEEKASRNGRVGQVKDEEEESKKKKKRKS